MEHSPNCNPGVEAVSSASSTSAGGRQNNEPSANTTESIGIASDIEMCMVVGAQSPNSLLGCHGLLNPSVKVPIGRPATSPHILTVGGVIATSIALLSTAVEDGDTTGEERVCQCILEGSPVGVDIEETYHVVVVDEGSQQLWTREAETDPVVLVNKDLWARFAGIDLGDQVVHGVVDQTLHVVLVIADITRIATEDFTDREDASGLGKPGPKVLFNVLDGVQTETIDRVGVDKVLDPTLENGPDTIVLGLDIGEIADDTAVFDIALIVEVTDHTVVMVVASVVERYKICVIVMRTAHVVGNDINHDIHSH